MTLLSDGNQQLALPTAKHPERVHLGNGDDVWPSGLDLAQVKAAHDSLRLILTCSSSLRTQRDGDNVCAQSLQAMWWNGDHIPTVPASRHPAVIPHPKSDTKTVRIRKSKRKSRKEIPHVRVVGKYTTQLVADQPAPLYSRCAHGGMRCEETNKGIRNVWR